MDEQAEMCKGDASDQMLACLDKLTREKANAFSRLERILRKKTRMEFDRKQATRDIERQLSGTAVNDEEAKEFLRIEDQMLPEQIYLLEKLFIFQLEAI